MASPPSAVDPGQAVTRHQPGDLATPDPMRAAHDQLGVDSSDPVGRSGRSMDLDDHIEQVGVLQVTVRGRSFGPLVVARRRDAQDPARHRDGEPVSGKLTNEPEPYFGSTFSRAK